MYDTLDADQLRERLEDLQTIMEDATVGTWRIEIEESRLPRMQMDDMFWRFLSLDVQGLSPEDIYELWLSKIRKIDHPNVNATIREMMRLEKAESSFVIVHPTLGDQYVRWGGRAKHVEGQGYVLVGYFKIVTDVMSQIRQGKADVAMAMRAAENAVLEKKWFFSDLAKDIEYAMESLDSHINAMERDKESQNQRAQSLGDLRRISAFVRDVMGGVLDMVCPNDNLTRVFQEPVNLLDIIEPIRQTVKSIISGYGKQNFNYEIQIEHNMVLSDPVRIRRIMTFLICRSLISTANGGNVNISIFEEPCEKEGCQMFVAIIDDDGQGIPYDRKPDDKILGFEVVRKLVEQLEGTIHLDSNMKGGSHVELSIPILVDYEASSASDVEKKVSTLRGKRALVTEDNELCAEILVEMLHELGIEAETASDGRKCVEMVEQHDESYYDVILMDIQMPTMDGYEAATTIRSMDNEHKSFLPIIAVTANGFTDDVAKAIDAGMNGFLGKPVEADVLLDTLTQIMY